MLIEINTRLPGYYVRSLGVHLLILLDRGHPFDKVFPMGDPYLRMKCTQLIIVRVAIINIK